MPVLHIQFGAEAQTPDGRTVQIPPNIVLIERGPCVQVTVTVAESIAQQLLQQGLPVPPPISGLALLDTGASVTCIDDGAARQLQLPVIDVVQIASASHASTQQNVYPIRIEVTGVSIAIDADRAIGAALEPQGLLVLIGRDVLQHFTLFYNGLTGQITLAV